MPVETETTDEGEKVLKKDDKWWLKLVNKNLPPEKPMPEICTDIFWMNTKVATVEKLWSSDFMENIISSNYMTEIEIARPYCTTAEDCDNFENYGKTRKQVPECFVTETGLVGFKAEEGIATEVEKHYVNCFSPLSTPLPKLLTMHTKDALKYEKIDMGFKDESEHLKPREATEIVLVEKGKDKEWKHQHQYVKVKRNGILYIQDGPFLPNTFTIDSVHGVRCPEPIIRNFRQSKIEMPKILSNTFSKVARDVTPKIRTALEIKRTFFARKVRHDVRVGFLKGRHEALPKMGLHQKADTIPLQRPVAQYSRVAAQENKSDEFRTSELSKEDGVVEIPQSTSRVFRASESSQSVEEECSIEIPSVYSYKPDWRTVFDNITSSEYTSWTFYEKTLNHSYTELVKGEKITYETEVWGYKQEKNFVQKVLHNVQRCVQMKRRVRVFDDYRMINTLKTIQCEYDKNKPDPSNVKKSNKLKLFRDTAIICQRRKIQSGRPRKLKKKFALVPDPSIKMTFGSLCIKRQRLNPPLQCANTTKKRRSNSLKQYNSRKRKNMDPILWKKAKKTKFQKATYRDSRKSKDDGLVRDSRKSKDDGLVRIECANIFRSRKSRLSDTSTDSEGECEYDTFALFERAKQVISENSSSESEDDGVWLLDPPDPPVCSSGRQHDGVVWIQPDPQMSDAMSDTSTDSEGDGYIDADPVDYVF